MCLNEEVGIQIIKGDTQKNTIHHRKLVIKKICKNQVAVKLADLTSSQLKTR
jgi:hypothetical protein